MAYATACFVPSESILTSVEAHINAMVSDETNVGHYALDSKTYLSSSIKANVRRKSPLSVKEMEAIKYHHSLKIEIGFADYLCAKPLTRTIITEFYMTVDEVMLTLVKTIGLRDDSGYGFIQAFENGSEKYIRGDIFFGDLLYAFEKFYGLPLKTSQVLIFKRKYLFKLMEKPADMIELDLAYAEV